MDSTVNNIANTSAEHDENQKMDIDVDIQELNACERHIKITIPRTEIDRYFESEFCELSEEAHVPGFRRGMAPRKLVEKRFKKEIGERVKNQLVMQSLAQISEHSGLTPISEPDFKYESIVLPETGPMIFEFNLEVRPSFELPKWQGLTIQRPVHEFTNEEVTRATERYLEQFGTLVPTNDSAQNGDYIVAKLIFRSNGEVVSQANEETIRIRPTLSFSDGLIKDFDQLMVGVKAGDHREAKISLSEDSPNPALRGTEIEASFEILEVKKLQLPELTHEFLDRIGEFKNIGDFRDGVLDSLKQQLDYEQRQAVRQQITKALTVSASWDIPQALLQSQAERELERMIIELRRSGYTDDVIKKEINYLRQNSRTVVAQSMKEHFILEKIAEVEDVQDNPEDYETEIKLIANQKGSNPRRIRSQLEKQGSMDILRNQIIERKVIDLILQHAKFVDVPYELEGITEEAINYTAGGSDHEIPEATEEDLKAVHKESEEKKMIDPNAK